MVRLPESLKKLIDEGKEKYPEKGIGFNFDEWNSFEEYEEYLKKLLGKDKEG